MTEVSDGESINFTCTDPEKYLHSISKNFAEDDNSICRLHNVLVVPLTEEYFIRLHCNVIWDFTPPDQ